MQRPPSLRLSFIQPRTLFWAGVAMFWVGVIASQRAALLGASPQSSWMRATVLYLCWTQIVIGVSEFAPRKETQRLWRAGAVVLTLAFIVIGSLHR